MSATIAATANATKHVVIVHRTKYTEAFNTLLCGAWARTKITGEGEPSCKRCATKLAQISAAGREVVCERV